MLESDQEKEALGRVKVLTTDEHARQAAEARETGNCTLHFARQLPHPRSPAPKRTLSREPYGIDLAILSGHWHVSQAASGGGILESLIWGPLPLPKFAGLGGKGTELGKTPALSQGHLNLSGPARVRATILEWMKVFCELGGAIG